MNQVGGLASTYTKYSNVLDFNHFDFATEAQGCRRVWVTRNSSLILGKLPQIFIFRPALLSSSDISTIPNSRHDSDYQTQIDVGRQLSGVGRFPVKLHLLIGRTVLLRTSLTSNDVLLRYQERRPRFSFSSARNGHGNIIFMIVSPFC